ncbi:MAG: efflux RND transporter periplasmic adaptor subunit [Minisyncoccales bacterium]
MANIILAIKRHKKISFVIFVIILAAGYFLFGPSGKSASATVYTYGTASKGNIVQSVSGSGQVAASDQVDVKSQVAGDIVAVNIVEGQSVRLGDMLARIDSTDAQAAVEVAQANLENAKLTLQQASQNNSQSLAQARQALQSANDDLATSQSNLSKTYEQAFNAIVSAFADLPVVMSGLSDIMSGSSNIVVQSSGTYLDYYQYQIKSYGSSVSSLLDVSSTYAIAKNGYDSVLKEYKSVSRYSDPEVISKMVDDTYDATKKISNATKALINLIQQYQDAASKNNSQAQSFSTTHLNSLNGYASQVNADLLSMISIQQSINSSLQSVESAKNTVDQKAQSLNTLQSLTNQISDQSQQLIVSQKETALADAKKTLSDYTIRASFDGLVAAVDVKKGDTISGNATIATIITDNQIATISLNEVDAASVKVGQKATLTFDAVSDLTLTGHVSAVDAIGTVSSGVVSYGVTIAFDTQDDRVKPGMSTTAAIVTNIKQDVLLVPNAAVKSNAAGNYVMVPNQMVSGAASGSSEDGVTVKQQTVVPGLADDNYTEIASGLAEGDTVVTKTATQAATKTSTGSSSALSRLFGGGGGPR